MHILPSAKKDPGTYALIGLRLRKNLELTGCLISMCGKDMPC